MIGLLINWKKNDWDSLTKYDTLAPCASKAVPTAEHFTPFLIACGTGDPDVKPVILNKTIEMGTLSYLCVQFD